MGQTGGKANTFQRDYLEANLKGTSFRGGTVESVSNKYIHTDKGSHIKKGLDISFEVKKETISMLRGDNSHDTEADRL